MKDYTVWIQVLNHDGTINSEDILAYCDTLEEAKKFGAPGDVIRYYEGCNGNWDWDVAENAYEEWKMNEEKEIENE